ncbi:hypothetical protein CLIB1423_06S04082 [[Candida] railenensis]|uniref:Uncharacterized protein n=1 Tax=[Candida] railenensis TaxID=45579 RepID=A0A9P0QP74_9ASCO|nr:hypothetical protein CLIB1423_06S04082 [[Candida] railenensis]
MSTYRTISMTDISNFNNTSSQEPDLKFSIKGFELDRKSATCTPKGFEYALFSNPLKEEYLPSEGSVVDDEKDAEDDIIVYGNNEILDFDSAAYETSAVPKREQRASYSAKVPLSIEEMKSRAPDLFSKNISLDDYFSVEQHFAFNIKHCYQSICPEEKYSEDLFMKPVSITQFSNSRNEFSKKLDEIVKSFHSLEESCTKLNNTIQEQYDEIKSSLKWEIFSNSTANKNFENGRSMFEALLLFKQTFQEFIHESDLWMEIDENVNQLNDLIIEWNEMDVDDELDMEEVEERRGQEDQVAQVSHVDMINMIESSLKPDSSFIRQGCCNFDSILTEVKILYEEFLNHFKSKQSEDGTFEYEICSFDDHIKEKIRQHSC